MIRAAHHFQSRAVPTRRVLIGHGPLSISLPPAMSMGGKNSARGALHFASPSRRLMSSKAQKEKLSNAAAAQTRAGSGKIASTEPYIKNRGPVSWPSLFLVGIAAASVVAYYNIERERRLESAMGRVVSSESDGWSPNPGVMAPRKFKLTPWGYFPEDDGFGPCKFAGAYSISKS